MGICCVSTSVACWVYLENSLQDAGFPVHSFPKWAMLLPAEQGSAVVFRTYVPLATFRSGSAPGKPGHQPG